MNNFKKLKNGGNCLKVLFIFTKKNKTKQFLFLSIKIVKCNKRIKNFFQLFGSFVAFHIIMKYTIDVKLSTS